MSGIDSYSRTLQQLGPGPPGSTCPASGPTPQHACYIDATLASGVKGGYRFMYLPGPVDQRGRITAFKVISHPLQPDKCNNYSFFVDETGVVRVSRGDRDATANDPPEIGRAHV